MVRLKGNGKSKQTKKTVIQTTESEPKPRRYRGCPEHKREYLERIGKHTFVCTQCASDYGKRVVSGWLSECEDKIADIRRSISDLQDKIADARGRLREAGYY